MKEDMSAHFALGRVMGIISMNKSGVMSNEEALEKIDRLFKTWEGKMIDESNDHVHICCKCGKAFDCSNYKCQFRRYSFHKVCIKQHVTEISRTQISKSENENEKLPATTHSGFSRSHHPFGSGSLFPE